MWYTILITLVVDFGGLLLVYLLLRDRVRRATSAESRISEIRDEVSRLLVELNQATDRNIALMEDKITVLNEAISTADKKIGLLRRETEKHDVGSQIYSRLAEGRHPRAAAAAAPQTRRSGAPRGPRVPHRVSPPLRRGIPQPLIRPRRLVRLPWSCRSRVCGVPPHGWRSPWILSAMRNPRGTAAQRRPTCVRE